MSSTLCSRRTRRPWLSGRTCLPCVKLNREAYSHPFFDVCSCSKSAPTSASPQTTCASAANIRPTLSGPHRQGLCRKAWELQFLPHNGPRMVHCRPVLDLATKLWTRITGNIEGYEGRALHDLRRKGWLLAWYRRVYIIVHSSSFQHRCGPWADPTCVLRSQLGLKSLSAYPCCILQFV